MLLTDKHIRQFAVFYLACFVVCYAWFAWHGLLFSSIKPVFFLNKPDLTHNIFMFTNLQHLLLQNSWLQVVFDVLYLLFPFLLTWSCVRQKKIQPLLALITALFSILYNSFFSSISYVSIENFLAFMIVPLIFCGRTVKDFYYLLHIIRLVFILSFFSAALWKIRAGGWTNVEEMSAILTRQHGSYLIMGNKGFYSSFISYLINHPVLSYILYLFAFAAEFIFVVGIFTRKADKLLLVAFILFVCFDYLLMGINYFTWVAFAGCLYFSKYRIAEE
ncbi:hypothetical protein [Ferruginibacter sp.]